MSEKGEKMRKLSGEEQLKKTLHVDIPNYLLEHINDEYYVNADWTGNTLISKLSFAFGIKEKTISQYLKTLENVGKIKVIQTENGFKIKVNK